ncbi:MAG: hypothetical protein K0S56_3084, partial [Microvirga sp.]|nr:hypothetical protein [Microvirga sp.]
RRKRAVTGPKSRQRKALYRRNRLESHCCPLRPAICGNVRLTLHAIRTLSRAIRVMVMTIVDTFTRFSPVVDPRFSHKGEDVVATLERICRSIGYPESIRVNQGSEFISGDLDLWPTRKAPCSTSPGQASRPTTASSWTSQFLCQRETYPTAKPVSDEILKRRNLARSLKIMARRQR